MHESHNRQTGHLRHNSDNDSKRRPQSNGCVLLTHTNSQCSDMIELVDYQDHKYPRVG